MDPTRLSRRTLLASIASLTTATAGCSQAPGAAVDRNGDAVPAGSGEDLATATPRPGADTAEGAYTEVYRRTIDSVTLVRTYGTRGSQGSGFVYDDRHLVTNEHVVADADSVRVQFRSGDWREATVVGTDVYSDLAALRVPDRPAYADPLALVETEPPIGTEVIALGNPFGLNASISQGIVTGKNRTLPAANGFSIADAVQTDAAVNPGNSGGPLVNLDAEVVAVINSGEGDNIGFGISAAMTRRVVPALIADGEYRHSYMGVRILPVTPTVAEANDLNAVRGVMIVAVVDDGPADGVLEGQTGETVVDGVEVPVGGDVVVGLGERSITTRQELSTFLALQTEPGDTIPVTVIRDGKRRTVQLTLGRRPRP